MDVCSLGFRTDLALLRLGGTEIEDRGDLLVVRTPGNPDYHWGNFVLAGPTEIVRARETFDEAFPDARHRAIAVDGDLGGADPSDLRVEVDTVLTATELTAPAWPNTEADHRPLRSDAEWNQLIELGLQRFDGGSLGFADFTRRRVETYRRWTEDGHGAWWGAFLGDRLVAGMGLFRAGDGMARFQDVETAPERRRRGLATTLAHRVGEWGLGELGVDRLVIVADPDDVAIRIYRRLGFVDTETMTRLYQARRC